MMSEPYMDPLRLKERLARIRHVALDMDGTLYLGDTLFPWTIPFLQRLRSLGIGCSFLTNNPTRSRTDYLRKLAAMGIEATPEQIYTSVEVTIDYLRRTYPEARRLFLLGTPSMAAQFEEAGFVQAEPPAAPGSDSPSLSCDSAAGTPPERPDAVVVSFDTTLTYRRLCRAAWWIFQGVPYVATNPDRVCPTGEETLLVDCGSLCKCIEEATGRKPEAVSGKPDSRMLEPLLRHTGLEPGQIAVVGDRLYTDIALAHRCDAFGVLVLSGETTSKMAAVSSLKADLTVDSVENFGLLLEDAHRSRQ